MQMRLLLALALLAGGPMPARRADAFMYRPATGLTWDPSCMTWAGKTYCYFMYVRLWHGHAWMLVERDALRARPRGGR